MGQVFTITNLSGYVSQVRDEAARSLCESYNENLDEYITLNQLTNFVKANCIGFDDEDRPLLDEDANQYIFENTAIWIHNAGLAKLAAQDLVECAWDDETNEMIFWPKEKNKNVKQRKPRRKNKKSEG